MPTYQYRCDKCGYEFEEFQRISDPPVNKCPRCKAKIRRLITGGSGVIFKGSGFYCTDYGRQKVKANDSTAKEEPGKADPAKEKAKD